MSLFPQRKKNKTRGRMHRRPPSGAAALAGIEPATSFPPAPVKGEPARKQKRAARAAKKAKRRAAKKGNQ